MKIAITCGYYNKKGGISRYVAELAERLAKENEVHVYSMGWEDVGSNEIIFHKVHGVHNQYLLEWLGFLASNTIRFKLKKNEFDILHTNGYESLYHDVITAHSIHIAALNYLKTNNMPRGLGIADSVSLTIEKLIYSKNRNYKKIIADSTSSKEELMKYYNVPDEDIVVIPLGVDLDEYKPLEKNKLTELRRKYRIDENDILLLIVATEFYRKGMVELINAISILIKQRSYNNIKLLIVGRARDEGLRRGDTYYREFASKLGVINEVIFTGHINDLNSHYNLADIFVFPTKYEAFGIPTLEAMAAGLAVLNSKIGAGELMTDGMDGIHLNNPNNIEEIADKLEMLINDEKLRRILGKNARKTAMKYSWDETARKTMEVYQQIME